MFQETSYAYFENCAIWALDIAPILHVPIFLPFWHCFFLSQTEWATLGTTRARNPCSGRGPARYFQVCSTACTFSFVDFNNFRCTTMGYFFTDGRAWNAGDLSLSNDSFYCAPLKFASQCHNFHPWPTEVKLFEPHHHSVTTWRMIVSQSWSCQLCCQLVKKIGTRNRRIYCIHS